MDWAQDYHAGAVTTSGVVSYEQLLHYGEPLCYHGQVDLEIHQGLYVMTMERSVWWMKQWGAVDFPALIPDERIPAPQSTRRITSARKPRSRCVGR